MHFQTIRSQRQPLESDYRWLQHPLNNSLPASLPGRTSSLQNPTLDDEDDLIHFVYKFNIQKTGVSEFSLLELTQQECTDLDCQPRKLCSSNFPDIGWFDWMRKYPEDEKRLLVKTSKQIESILIRKFGSSDFPPFLPVRLKNKLNCIFRLQEKVCISKEYVCIPNRERYIQLFEEIKTERELHNDKTQGLNCNCEKDSFVR